MIRPIISLSSVGGAGSGSVDGTAINPSSIGATTPADSVVTDEIIVNGTFTSNVIFERMRGYYDSGSGAFVIGTEKGASGGSARPLNIMVNGTVVAHARVGGYGMHFSHGVWVGSPGDVGSARTIDIAQYCIHQSLASGVSFLWESTTTITGSPDTSCGRLGVARLAVGNGTHGNTDGSVTLKSIRTKPVTFAKLPAAATVGDGEHAFITDSNLSYNSVNIGSAVSGGGANPTPVVTIGGAWVVG